MCTAVLKFQMEIPGICTPDAPNGFTCPGVNTFFTAAVFWGTIGPKKVFGPGGQYTPILAGFPLGVAFTLAVYLAQRRFRSVRWLRQVSPVLMLGGALIWAPYNIGYVLPGVPIAFVSWIVVKNRRLAFWSKYNYVLSASWSCAIALAAVVIFFALQYREVELQWWGNEIVAQGCEAKPCVKVLEPGTHFGPGPGEFR